MVPKENTKTLKVSSSDFINSVERVASVSIDRKEGVKLELSRDKLNYQLIALILEMEMKLLQQNMMVKILLLVLIQNI